jgi:hypothetical protein
MNEKPSGRCLLDVETGPFLLPILVSNHTWAFFVKAIRVGKTERACAADAKSIRSLAGYLACPSFC